MAIVDTNTMDLTGADELFFRDDHRFMVFKSPQIINFGQPVFANEKLKVFKYDAETSEWVLLNSSSNYIIPSENNYASLLDTDAMSQGKLQAASTGTEFSSKLISAIIINDPSISSEYQILVQYQQFYKDPSAFNVSGQGPAYTPALMQAVLQKLDFLENVKNPVTSVANDAVNRVIVMTEDYTGNNENNRVYNEEHQVNVVDNKFVIRPANGSFYKHDITLRATGYDVRAVTEDDIDKRVNLNTGDITLTRDNISSFIGVVHRIVISSEPLVEGDDYIIKGINGGKTRASLHSSGVYDYIVILKKLVGSVYVSYRAFGGEISIADINVLKNGIIAINNVLANGNFVTTENLPTQELIINILDRLESIEEFIRHYALQQFPYNIASFEHSSKVYSKNSWVDVAVVDHGPWSEFSSVPSIYNGSFKLDIESEGYYSEFELKYNLNQGLLDIVDKRITSTSYDGDGVAYFNNRITPKFRIVYRSDDIHTPTIITQSNIGDIILVDGVKTLITSDNYQNYGGTEYDVVTNGHNRGLVLQMSISGITSRTVNVNFYETSGISGIWSLVDSANLERPITTYETTLPGNSGDETWTAGVDGHETTNTAILNDSDYTIFVGNIPIDVIDNLTYKRGTGNLEEADEDLIVDLNGMTVAHIIGNQDVDIDSIKAIRFTIFDRLTNKYLVEETSQVNAYDNKFNSIAMYYINDLCSIECAIVREDQNLYVDEVPEVISNYSVTVKSRSGTNSINNKRFDLRKIDLVF